MLRRLFLRLSALAALAFGFSCAAHATTFDFSYSGSGMYQGVPFTVSASGTLTGTYNAAEGGYDISGITGTRNGIAIVGPANYFNNDQILFYPASPHLDSDGIAYQAGSANYLISYSSGYQEVGGPNTATITSFTVSEVTAVPAPSPGGGLLSFLALGLTIIVARRDLVLTQSRRLLASLGQRRDFRRA